MSPTDESFARVGDIQLCWQRFGAEDAPPMLLIMGLGAQMILWPDGLCEELAGRGFGVIRFDNRDCGRSTVLDGVRAPSISDALAGDVADAPYTLSDMAADTAGLLDALGIERAHVVGSSLGGMVAQTLAIERPGRVLSLASIMSTTGDPEVGKPTDAGMEALTNTPPPDREGYIESTDRARAMIGSPGFPRDEEFARDVAARSFDRGYHGEGTLRQVIAIIASGDRTERLRELDVPTVVIHGTEDALIGFSGGQATAAAIPGSRFVEIPGMGHDIPQGTWETIADAVVANTERAPGGEVEEGAGLALGE